MNIIVRDVIRTFFPQYNTSNKTISTILQSKNQIQQPKQMERSKSSRSNGDKKTNISNKKITQQGLSESTNNRQKQAKQLIQKQQTQIQQFILSHHLHIPSLTVSQILHKTHLTILSQLPSLITKVSKLKSYQKSPLSINQSLYQLSLYLNKQTNKQIFTVYQHILINSGGISYDLLARKLKTDIINVSHYCCKLKKMRFVQWQHRKDGVLVYPKIRINPKNQYNHQFNIHNRSNKTSQKLKLQQLNPIQLTSTFNYNQSFIFQQLTLNQNIVINVASAFSLQQNGLTNQQIKFKIMKHAENKMVRRTVQGMKDLEKNAERQGKVFQFKYRKETIEMKQELDKRRLQTSCIVGLNPKCCQFLRQTFPQQQMLHPASESLLLSLINTLLTQYISSIGPKQSKRQCTPLKLNRYIYILNFLQQNGPDTQYQLRKHIIMKQQGLVMNGIIHKRSVVGILEGLARIGVLTRQDQYYYPSWGKVQDNQQRYQNKTRIRQALSQYDMHGHKKIKQDNQLGQNSKANSHKKRNKDNFIMPNQKIRMITVKQHLNQIFISLVTLTFQKALIRTLRKSFHRILHPCRKNQSLLVFTPSKSILHLLSQPSPSIQQIKTHSTTLNQFINQIDCFVEEEGREMNGIGNVEYQVVKYVRRNPIKGNECLRTKYGRMWKDKFQPLNQCGIISITQQGYTTNSTFKGFLV